MRGAPGLTIDLHKYCACQILSSKFERKMRHNCFRQDKDDSSTIRDGSKHETVIWHSLLRRAYLSHLDGAFCMEKIHSFVLHLSPKTSPQCCACHEKSPSNKYCACHERWRWWLIAVLHATSSTVLGSLLYFSLLYSSLSFSTLLFSSLSFSTLLFSSLLHSSLLYYSLLHSTLLYFYFFYSLLFPTIIYS